MANQQRRTDGTHFSTEDRRSASAERTTPDAITNQMIGVRAYELYEQRGSAHGHDLDDWLRAECELRAVQDGRES